MIPCTATIVYCGAAGPLPRILAADNETLTPIEGELQPGPSYVNECRHIPFTQEEAGTVADPQLTPDTGLL